MKLQLIITRQLKDRDDVLKTVEEIAEKIKKGYWSDEGWELAPLPKELIK